MERVDELAGCIRAWRDRLAPVDAAGHIVAWNSMAAALHSERERNIPWRFFTGGPSRVMRDEAEESAAAADIVAGLQKALGRHPEDPPLRELIADLRAASERFEALWQRHPVARQVSSRKAIGHPRVGPVTLDCDVLRVTGADLDLAVHTAVRGSEAASRLAMIGALGLQESAFPSAG